MPNDDIIKSGQELATVATDLLDSEVQQVTQIIFQLQQRYQHRASTAANLEKLRDEVLTKLADIGILANVDPTPALYGDPPIVDIVGKVGDPGFTKAFDHEQKGYEVKKATQRGEDYLGQKERANTRKPKQ